MEIEVFVTKVLHTLNLTDYDRARALIDGFTSSKPGSSRIRIIQLIVQYCEYVCHYLNLLHFLSIIPGCLGVSAICLSEFLRIDTDSTLHALEDPVLLYPMIEGIEQDDRCIQFLIDYGQVKTSRGDSFTSESLRILRFAQDKAGQSTRSHSRLPYSKAREVLVRVWSDIPSSIPPHLKKDDYLLSVCFRWLESSPRGSDRQPILKLIKSYGKKMDPIVFNSKIVSILFGSLTRSESLTNDPEPSPSFYLPEQVQLVIPLIDFNTLPVVLFAILENSGTDKIMHLWTLLLSWPLIAPSKETGIHLSKVSFNGSIYPLLGFMAVYVRVAVKICSSGPNAPNWRIILETMLRMALCRIYDQDWINETSETLVYLLKLDVPGRPWPSLLHATGHPEDSVAISQSLVDYAETVFNKLSASSSTRERAGEKLHFLNALIRTLQEDILTLKREKTVSSNSTIPPSLVQLPPGPLEVARMASVGMTSAESQKILSDITQKYLPKDATLLLTTPLGSLQQVLPTQPLVAPVITSAISTNFPTGTSGIEIPFRTSKFAGIQNFNNTCYLSSFLQSLFITDAFCSFVYGFKLIKGEKTEDTDFQMGKTILKGFKVLFARLLKTHHKHIEISEFIRSLPPSYRSGEQQDVTESGRWIFDKIGGTDQQLVKSIFGGEMIHKTQCLNCKRITERKELFTDLCVSVPKESEVLGKKKVTVQSLIKQMLKPESLNGDNKYSCEQCNSKQDASRWIEITQFPTHLMLVMHKFSYDVKACDFKKEKTAVYPGDGSVDLCGNKYDMYGAIMHYGESAMKGHYVAIGKRSSLVNDKNAKWVLFDDSVATPMSEADAMEKISGLDKPANAGYVLLFKHATAPMAVNPRIPQGCLDEALAIEQAAVHM